MAIKRVGFTVSKSPAGRAGKGVFHSVSGGGGKTVRVMDSGVFQKASKAASRVLTTAGTKDGKRG